MAGIFDSKWLALDRERPNKKAVFRYQISPYYLHFKHTGVDCDAVLQNVVKILSIAILYTCFLRKKNAKMKKKYCDKWKPLFLNEKECMHLLHKRLKP